MIEFTKAYVVGEHTFASLEQAQIAVLSGICNTHSGIDQETSTKLAKGLLEDASEVIDALTMTEKSKPKARSIHGGTKKRKAKGSESMAEDLKTRDHTP